MEVNVATGKYMFLSPEIEASRATSIDATLYMRHQDFNIIFSSSKRSDLWLRNYFIVALIRGLTIIFVLQDDNVVHAQTVSIACRPSTKVEACEGAS